MQQPDRQWLRTLHTVTKATFPVCHQRLDVSQPHIAWVLYAKGAALF